MCDPFTRLNAVEQEYVRGLRKRDRTGVVRLLERPRVGSGAAPLRIRVLQSQLPEHVRVRIFDELRGDVGSKYVNWVLKAVQLPLLTRHAVLPSTPAKAVAAARTLLDARITGHADAKLEVLKLVCQAHTPQARNASAYSLGFEGPPGTGKTHFVKNALAPALQRPLVSIPLGGATDVSYLLGSVYTYEGSKEGRLAAAFLETKCCNPIIHLDEVDKISETERGREIVSVLIHLIDPSANTALRDRYFHDIDLDFSKCTFVFSYNDASLVHPILLDRIKRVKLEAPTRDERTAILREHLLPRAQSRLGTRLRLADDAMDYLLERSEGGMRGLEKELDHVLATAQLEALTSEDVKDEVTSAFARRVLHAKAETREAPPPNMYL
jgi:ATP-dependent Lon protease